MRAILLVLAVVLVLAVPGGSLYYSAGGSSSCSRCHEIKPAYDLWHGSAHRGVACASCHGGTLTLDAGFHLNNLNRLATHLQGKTPAQISIRPADVDTLVERCRSCHRQEFADWQSGPHSITYKEIFLDREHNTKRLLQDDCFRCHGMFFAGSAGDMVTPVNTKGPWKLVRQDMADVAAVPCLACHSMHRLGNPLQKAAEKPKDGAARQEIHRPSLALYDRRSREYLPVSELPLPAMLEGERAVKMSPDLRQSLCYQCHAPWWTRQVMSGDDRTPTGVHEGLSCMACHEKHSQKTRASCATCHPRLSNCGLDVEKMDTTFRDVNSKHNIHFVKCADCHPKGVPPKRVSSAGLR